MKKHSFLFFLPIALIFSLLVSQHLYGAADQTEPVLKEIKFVSITAEHEQITFLFDDSSVARIFTFNGEKPRIIVDLPETVPAITLANTIKTGGKLVERIRMGIHKGDKAKTRIVLDLALDMEISYKRTVDRENDLLVLSVYRTGSEPELPQVGHTTPDTQKLLSDHPDKETKEEDIKGGMPESTEKDIKEKLQEPLSAPPAPPEKRETEETKTVEPVLPVEPVEPAELAKPAETKNTTTPILHSISFDNSTGKGEMVQFQLNGFYPPKVVAIEEGTPRVICDFKNTTLAVPIADIIKSDSQFIKSIRVGKHDDPDKIRVVIDLAPDNNYDLKQIFFKEDNMFVIIVNSTGK